MKRTAPQFLLLTQAQSNPDHFSRGGVWRFVLEQLGSSNRIEVAEDEMGVWGERLQLLAVVRGLEALEQPSKVTLISPSRVVGHGIRIGLAEWRVNGWQWERFGKLAPVKHQDLWKRIDQALQYHQVDCRVWDFDEPHVERAPRPVGRNRISLGEIESARKASFAESTVTSLSQQQPTHCQSISNSVSHTHAGSVPMNDAQGFISQQAESIQQVKRDFVDPAIDRITQATSALADRVKPVGSGRAYGYVPN